MSKHIPINMRHGERGEGNTKFIVTMTILAIIGYTIYAVMPVYYKEQQLRHDIREKTRIGAVNGYEAKRLETDCKKIVDDIDFPEKIDVKVTKKGDNVTIACAGVVPIRFLFYTYKYKIDFDEKYSRSGY